MKSVTKAQMKRLIECENLPGLEYVGEQFIYMDSHGENVKLHVCKRDDGSLVGFPVWVNSEEINFWQDPAELIPLVAEEVTRTEYKRADGDEWDF